MESGGPPDQQPGGGPPPPPPAGSGTPPPPPPPPGAPPGAGPQSPGTGPQPPGPQSPGPQSPPPAPGPQSPGSPPGAGPQPPGPPPGQQWGAPPGAAPQGYGQPGYGQPGQAPGYQPPPGYGTPGAPVAYGYAPALPPVLQGREFAGYGARVGAYLLDTIVVLLGLIIFGYLLQCWFMGREDNWNGQTIGRRACGIRAIREDGQPWNFGTALLREFVIKYLLFGLIGGFVFFGWLVDVLWPLWDERKQALHDKVIGSYVVKA